MGIWQSRHRRFGAAKRRRKAGVLENRFGFWGRPLQLNLNKLSDGAPKDASSLGWDAGGPKNADVRLEPKTNL
ncbi:MAG: hypothetical protein KGI83_03905 [Verrucomicrobiota bacterium]|nr:hypothetical protein [Verrucomicrobiota bacterium]